jgi:hypothetical protein
MAHRTLLTLIGCLLIAGCAAARQPQPVGGNCERTCREEWESCKGSCIKAVDPTGHLGGARESCERVCTSQREVCDVSCLKARGLSP